MSLDIRKAAEEIRSMYKDARTSKYFRALIFGDVGTGKTTLLKTCPKPIHVDSFDPGGTTSIRKQIEEGWIIADVRYEDEDPKDPKALKLYDEILDKRIAEGYFNYFGTYALDSLTTFGDAGLNYILKKNGRPGGIPQAGKGSDNDYVKQQSAIEPILRKLLNLPCHVIFIAHPDMRESDTTKVKSIGPKVYGQLATKLPLLFSEIYCAQAKEVQNGIEYSLLTRQTGYWRCRSRLAATGKIDMYETQDIKKLLAKADFDNSDKPMDWING